MEKNKLAGIVDLGTLIGVPANLIVVTTPQGQGPKGISVSGEGAMHYVFMIMTTPKEQAGV